MGIVRCVAFWSTRAANNPTIDLMPLAYWSCIECLTAILCACLPDCRFFFSRLVPTFYRAVASSVRGRDRTSRKDSRGGSSVPGSATSYWTLEAGAGSSQAPSRQGRRGSGEKKGEVAIGLRSFRTGERKREEVATSTMVDEV